MSQTIVNPVYRKRLWKHRIGIALSVLAMSVGLIFLLWILSTLLIKGFAGVSLDLFLNDTPGPDSEGGGLRNAILGSLMIVGLATFISTPVGILAGVYLAEYGEENRFAQITRFVTDIMLSAPSIVLGIFVWTLYVNVAGHYSGYAGSIALSLIAIPVVVRTTDNMLRLVPQNLLEAAFALGAPRWKVATTVRLRAVKSGVVTGVLLAVARITGETAPLLYTALNNQFFSSNMNAPIANLPVVINTFAQSTADNWVNLAWAASLLLTFSVLLLNILSRTMFSQKTTK
ncbi:phosphate ABC transporter permease PstA [Massilia violaceinigra]|uniref:Phosphate transport system permease protein PstA n=1 Tax=Massilia violaceinigra TaxID=2045208 RepID=A0ABY4A116_9BURK|nr:phosphate ABC transporter permease PstA [Massilia violaceinigra]UOD28363.1 phosphate ABC transporter permease PstA [Massilia violaceinigra]